MGFLAVCLRISFTASGISSCLTTGINQVAAVSKSLTAAYRWKGKPGRWLLEAMKEVQRIAAREGVALTDFDVKAWMDLLDSLNPEGMPSMWQDTAAHRKTEVELFSGTIRRLGKKYGIKTPVNDFLYWKIKQMEDEWEN